jgi:hypothetical protein
VVKNDFTERGLQVVALIASRSQLPFMNILVTGNAPVIFEQIGFEFLAGQCERRIMTTAAIT